MRPLKDEEKTPRRLLLLRFHITHTSQCSGLRKHRAAEFWLGSRMVLHQGEFITHRRIRGRVESPGESGIIVNVHDSVAVIVTVVNTVNTCLNKSRTAATSAAATGATICSTYAHHPGIGSCQVFS